MPITPKTGSLFHAETQIKLSLWFAVSLLLGAFAASLAAVEGGQLRDGTWNDRVLTPRTYKEAAMGRGVLLWLLGAPIPIIILLTLFAR